MSNKGALSSKVLRKGSRPRSAVNSLTPHLRQPVSALVTLLLTRCRSGQLSDVLPCSVLWASDSNSLICLQPKPINGGSMVIRAEEADNYVMVKKRIIISITIDT